MAVRNRDEVPFQDCWDIESMYPSREDWLADLGTYGDKGSPVWPNLAPKNYTLESPNSLYALITTMTNIERKLDRLYTYAHLIHDQDISNQDRSSDLKAVTHLLTQFSEETAWVQPALIQLPASTQLYLLNAPELTPYQFYLEKIFRLAPHTKTPQEEKLLASLLPALEVSYKTFSSLSDAEIPFGIAVDEKGNTLPLSHALASFYSQSPDRTLRRSSYLAQAQRYHDYRLSFANLLNGKVQAHLFYAKAKNYDSCLDAALFNHAIPKEVFINLLRTVEENTLLITEYYRIKQSALQLDEMHFYDVYAPLGQTKEACYSYDDAVSIICESLAPLGNDYISTLRCGLTDARWVDRYENLNKRSGAYSSGCYDSKPYILLNYSGSLYDISVLAHEAGHSMHSYLSNQCQSYHNAKYPIFLAEIASTLNETLLMDSMLKKSVDKREQIAILNRTLDTIFATLFRQVLFASFEYKIHKAAEQGVPLTEAFFSSTYKSLQAQFYGDCIVADSLSHIEWARIPHFYYNFYVYQYATGIIAALCFAEKILNCEQGAVETYLNFLKSGGSTFPLHILNNAGLDMRTTEPIHKAFSFIQRKINALAELQ